MLMAQTPMISPREAARAFTPELTELINEPLYARVWADDRLSPRDRSLVTLGALVALYRPDELRAQLVRAADNGVSRAEISALITHVAFYGGFPAAISASVIAHEILDAPPAGKT
jgi:4-carboxymuconolactone decarboxylase